MAADHGDDALRAGLDSLERRIASTFPGPLRDPARYLKALMPAEASRVQRRAAERDAATQPAALEGASREQQDKRSARWLAEWTRRRHEQCAAAIEALGRDRQQELVQGLLQVLHDRQAHPSMTKRLATTGWQHPLVRHEMLRYFGAATYGDGWDKPRAEDLLAIAIELGEERDAGR
jgi:hypothetical protein